MVICMVCFYFLLYLVTKILNHTLEFLLVMACDQEP